MDSFMGKSETSTPIPDRQPDPDSSLPSSGESGVIHTLDASAIVFSTTSDNPGQAAGGKDSPGLPRSRQCSGDSYASLSPHQNERQYQQDIRLLSSSLEQRDSELKHRQQTIEKLERLVKQQEDQMREQDHRMKEQVSLINQRDQELQNLFSDLRQTRIQSDNDLNDLRNQIAQMQGSTQSKSIRIPPTLKRGSTNSSNIQTGYSSADQTRNNFQTGSQEVSNPSNPLVKTGKSRKPSESQPVIPSAGQDGLFLDPAIQASFLQSTSNSNPPSTPRRVTFPQFGETTQSQLGSVPPASLRDHQPHGPRTADLLAGVPPPWPGPTINPAYPAGQPQPAPLAPQPVFPPVVGLDPNTLAQIIQSAVVASTIAAGQAPHSKETRDFKPDAFKGEEFDIWSSYQARLERYVQRTGWDDSRKVLNLPEFLTGTAREYFLSQPEELRNTWDRCMVLMDERWNLEDTEDRMTLRFEHRRRKAKEPLASYADALEMIAGKAFSDDTAASRARRVRQQFVSGLEPPALRRKAKDFLVLYREKNMTTKELVSLVQRIELNLEESQLDAGQPPANATSVIPRSLTYPNQPRLPLKPSFPGCYDCGDPTHIRRFCPKRQRDQINLVENDPGIACQDQFLDLGSCQTQGDIFALFNGLCRRCGQYGHMEKDCKSEMRTPAARQDDKYPTVLDLADKVRTLEKAQNEIAKAQNDIAKAQAEVLEGQSNITKTLQAQFPAENANRTPIDNPLPGSAPVDQFGFSATASFPTFQPTSQPEYYPYRPPVVYAYSPQQQPAFQHSPSPRYVVRNPSGYYQSVATPPARAIRPGPPLQRLMAPASPRFPATSAPRNKPPANRTVQANQVYQCLTPTTPVPTEGLRYIDQNLATYVYPVSGTQDENNSLNGVPVVEIVDSDLRD